jgi:hypothetical protein
MTLPPTPTRLATSKQSKKRAVKKTRRERRPCSRRHRPIGPNVNLTEEIAAEVSLSRSSPPELSPRDSIRAVVAATRRVRVALPPARCRRSRRSIRPNKRSPRRAAPRGGTPGAHSRTRLRTEAVSRPSSPGGRRSFNGAGEDAYEGNLASLESTVTLISVCTQPQFVRLKVSPKPVPRSHSLLLPGGEASRSPGSKPGRTAAYGRRRRWPLLSKEVLCGF